MGIIKNYLSSGNCKVTFSYPLNAASGAKTIQVLGDFNNWDSKSAPKLKKGKDSYSAIVELANGNTYQYRYLLDGTKWDNDFDADGYTQSPYPGITNSVLILNAELKTVQSPAKPVKAPVEKTVKLEKATSAKSPKINTVKEVKKSTVKGEKGAVLTKETKSSTAKIDKAETTKSIKTTDIKKVADDLKKIEGIGPKIAEILNSKGIVTFKDLAKAKVESLKKILDAAGPKFNVHEPTTWPQQAALAANGNWSELKKLQDELNAGKAKK